MYLSKNTFVEPDLVIYPRGIELEQVKGADIVLAIEVALTSLAYDRGLKAQLYARHEVRELWVIDAKERRTHIHTACKAAPGQASSSGPSGFIDLRRAARFFLELGLI